MITRFHRAARREFTEAVSFYETRVAGLGAAFAAEVQHAEGEIARAPARYARWAGTGPGLDIRRYVLRDFPYALPYAVIDQVIIILAVAHTRRRPGYWLRRLDD